RDRGGGHRPGEAVLAGADGLRASGGQPRGRPGGPAGPRAGNLVRAGGGAALRAEPDARRGLGAPGAGGGARRGGGRRGRPGDLRRAGAGVVDARGPGRQRGRYFDLVGAGRLGTGRRGDVRPYSAPRRAAALCWVMILTWASVKPWSRSLSMKISKPSWRPGFVV